MATKRQLKKNISLVCGDLAAELLLAAHVSANVDREKVHEIVRQIAALQEGARTKCTFWFDKTPRDFAENLSEYKKARRQYFKAAYKQLRQEFGQKAVAIVKEMNSLIPAEARKAIQ